MKGRSGMVRNLTSEDTPTPAAPAPLVIQSLPRGYPVSHTTRLHPGDSIYFLASMCQAGFSHVPSRLMNTSVARPA